MADNPVVEMKYSEYALMGKPRTFVGYDRGPSVDKDAKNLGRL